MVNILTILLIRVSVIRGENRQDVLSRQSSESLPLQSITSLSRDQDSDSYNSQTDSDIGLIPETPQISSSSRLPRHRFRQVPMDEASSAYFSDADALPHNLESTPFSDLESEPLLSSSEFESLSSSSDHDQENSSSVLDSSCNSGAEPANKRQKRTHLTHDRLLTQIGLQPQACEQSSSSRPSRSQAPKNYARTKRSYIKRK